MCPRPTTAYPIFLPLLFLPFVRLLAMGPPPPARSARGGGAATRAASQPAPAYLEETVYARTERTVGVQRRESASASTTSVSPERRSWRNCGPSCIRVPFVEA